MGGFGVSTCRVGCQIVDVLLSSGEDVIRWTGQCWEEPRNLSLWMLVDHWVMDRFQLARNKMDLPMMALMSPQYGNATLAGEWKMLQWLTCLALSTNAKVLKLDNDVLLILTESEEIHGMDCHCINLINFTSISVTELLSSWILMAFHRETYTAAAGNLRGCRIGCQPNSGIPTICENSSRCQMLLVGNWL